jgi:hypothetical protein
MENYAGETLDWYWRGWFMNNWKIDLAVTDVTPVDRSDSSKGSIITIATLEKLPMPVTVEVTEASGKKGRVTLPVEIWHSGSTWKFKYNSTDKVTRVVIDPDKKYPDANKSNNVWEAE